MARKLPWKAAASSKSKTASSTPAKKGTTFLDLPGEVRNQIYGYVLPDQPHWYMRPGRALRQDGQKSSTNFMATCHKIHDEAASILYGADYIDVYVSSSGAITLLNLEVAFPDISTANFAAINQIKALHLSVSGSDRVTVCDVQDALFAFFDHLRPNHKLLTLNVHINIDMASDRSGGYEIFTSNYAERMFKQNLMHEFRDIRPGDTSRAHLTAFLTDPLRTIRNLYDGKKKGKFTLDFDGKSGKPWRDIQYNIRAMVQGNSSVPNYKLFSNYFEGLRALQSVVGTLEKSFAKKSNADAQLATARIRGDVKDFKRQHKTLVANINEIVEKKPGSTGFASYQEAEQHEHKLREAIYLMQELETALPADDADTSFLGYNEADEALREWQATGREAEKVAKAKRKREREVKTAPQKKAKVGR